MLRAELDDVLPVQAAVERDAERIWEHALTGSLILGVFVTFLWACFLGWLSFRLGLTLLAS